MLRRRGDRVQCTRCTRLSAEPTSRTAGYQAIAYVAFLLIGLIELRFQWHLLFDLDRSGLVQYYFESLLTIPWLALVGCFIGLRAGAPPLLRTLAVMTLVVGFLQFLGELTDPSQLTRDVVNGVDRAYGVMCVIAWPLARLVRGRRNPVLVLAALLAVSVPLSVAWKWEEQRLVWIAPPPAGHQEYLLFDAAQRGDLELVRRLLQEGARVDMRDTGGGAVLIYAAEGGNVEVVRLLLQRGADPDVQDKIVGMRCFFPAQGPDCYATGTGSTMAQTPLMVAAARGNADIARMLLDAGADTSRRDANGQTALQLARRHNHVQVVALLEHRPN